jgi:hypothetical protein
MSGRVVRDDGRDGAARLFIRRFVAALLRVSHRESSGQPDPRAWQNKAMPTTGIRTEDAMIDLFLTVYDDCSWAGVQSVKASPERSTDGGVEMLATQARDGRKLAIEHTLIEPFVGEKTDFYSHYQELARQLKADESFASTRAVDCRGSAGSCSPAWLGLAGDHRRRPRLASSWQSAVSSREDAPKMSLSSPSGWRADLPGQHNAA